MPYMSETAMQLAWGPEEEAFRAEIAKFLEEQKKLARPTLRGDVLWSIGMSEPNAGSDLASLRTRAELRGDHFVVNGQKIWTSGGHIADWGILLARTDP